MSKLYSVWLLSLLVVECIKFSESGTLNVENGSMDWQPIDVSLLSYVIPSLSISNVLLIVGSMFGVSPAIGGFFFELLCCFECRTSADDWLNLDLGWKMEKFTKKKIPVNVNRIFTRKFYKQMASLRNGFDSGRWDSMNLKIASHIRYNDDASHRHAPYENEHSSTMFCRTFCRTLYICAVFRQYAFRYDCLAL